MAELILMGDPRVAAVPVCGSNEGLVDVRQVDGLSVASAEAARNGVHSRLRWGVVLRLLEAQAHLPGDLRLLVVEGYRTYEVQELYFAGYARELQSRAPTLDPGTIRMLASRHVSPPAVAPHVSGAAVDLTLTEVSGHPLDMGTAINATPESSEGACYFRAESISSQARYHRQLLGDALSRVGLVNYPTEWWHWSFGDRYWALMQGRPAAIYEPVADLAMPAASS